MKKITISTLLMLLLTASTFATVRTVSNVPLVKAQYSNIATAISEATAGDTLYLMNTGGSYGTVTLTKALTVIGENWDTKIDNLNFSNNLDMLNNYIESLNIANLNYDVVVNNINVRNCKLATVYFKGSNWNVWNNYCFVYSGYLYIRDINGLYFVNNIVYSGSGSIYNYGSVRTNCNFMNNTFFCAYNYWGIFGNNLTGISFVGNIFYGANPQTAYNSSFNNNLTYNCSDNTLPYGTNGGTNNILNQNPLFVNYVSAAVGSYNLSNDLRLADASPAKNTGLDGTDIGITGGLYPWRKNADGTLDMSGEPKLPKVISLTVVPTVINVNNQQMQINAIGKKK